jgi:hypothetical protein
MTFSFETEISILLYSPPFVYLILGFGASATLEYALVRITRLNALLFCYHYSLTNFPNIINIIIHEKTLDSKGIREAVQEKSPLKALNSFAIRDVIDGVDSPLIALEAKATVAIEASAVFILIGASGGLTARVGEKPFFL